MRGWISTLRHRIRYAFDADYRIECIADAVELRLQPTIEAGVRDEIDHIGQRVAKTISASFSD
jgi:hypothetical protein